MVSKKVTVKNPTGLHLRPAGILCNEAMKYQSQITFVYDGGDFLSKLIDDSFHMQTLYNVILYHIS